MGECVYQCLLLTVHAHAPVHGTVLFNKQVHPNLSSADTLVLFAQDEPHYIHAEHMYEPWNIKHQKIKWGVAITLFLTASFGLPFYAVHWQQKKAAG